jgi:L-ascorbate metabolism protein UlaG (beta-lactamase superfamily)
MSVLAPLRHVGDLARFRANRSARERADAQTLAELEARALEFPRGLELEWLGVSGYRLTHEDKTLFVDPYVSRVPFSSLLRNRTALPDPAMLDRFIDPRGEVVGVLVGHTHFDHAVDAPAICRRYGCKAYGSDSLVRLMALHGLADQGVSVEPYRTYQLGPFAVSFTPSAHSKLLLGLAVPMDGELTCDHVDGLCPRAYRCGQVWGIRIEVAGVSLYHQGSADLIDEALRPGRVDYMLAGIAGRSFTPRYWRRILPKLDPEVIVPTHYDDFWKPLDSELGFLTNVDLTALSAEVETVSGDARIAALPRIDEPASYG